MDGEYEPTDGCISGLRLTSAEMFTLCLARLWTLAREYPAADAMLCSGFVGGEIDPASVEEFESLLLILSAMNQRGGLPIDVPDFMNAFFAWVWSMSDDRAEGVLILGAILVLFNWMSVARLVRGQILALRNMEFTDAARALGASPWRIITRHMIPNALAPIIVQATFDFGNIIVLEAALSFVGFGVQPPSASWGNMLNNVRDFMLVQPWRAFVPGLAIFLASISYNFVGDALRDALDPRKVLEKGAP